MSDIKLWHVVIVGVLSAVVSVAVTLHIAALFHWQRDTEGAIKSLIVEVERVDKNTQVIMGIVSGRPPRGSLGVQP